MRCGHKRERDDANIKEIIAPSKRLNVAQAIADNPTLNSTELAQKLAGGYSGGSYPKYTTILLKINEIKGVTKSWPPTTHQKASFANICATNYAASASTPRPSKLI